MDKAEKLHSRLLKPAYKVLEVARQYLDAECTGAKVLSSLHNLLQRAGTFEACAASGNEAQSTFVHLLQFDGIEDKVLRRHKEEIQRAAGNVSSVIELLRALQDGLKAAQYEMQDLFSKGSAGLTSADCVSTTALRPTSVNDLLELADAAASGVAYDLTYKLLARQQVEPLKAMLTSKQQPEYAKLTSDVEEALGEWLSPPARLFMEIPHVPSSKMKPATPDAYREASWARLNDLCWRLTGQALVVKPSDNDDDGDDDGGGDGDR